jgi:O-antigen ligase
VRRLSRWAAEPSSWLAAAVLALPASSGTGPGGSLATPSDLLLFGAVAAAARLVLRGERKDVLRSVPAAGFLLLGLVSLLAAVVSPDLGSGLVGAVRSMELFFLVPVTVMVALRTRRDAVLVLGSIVLLAVLEGAYGLVQTVTRTGASIDGENIRAVGTFGAYNIAALAQLAAIALVICAAAAVVLRDRRRWVALGLAAFLALPLVLALSRGIWVGAAAAAALVLSRGRPLRMLAVALGSAAVLALVIPPLIASGSDLGQRVESLVEVDEAPDQSVRDRLALWGAARQMAVDHPLTGVGVRGFPDHRDAYAGLTLLGSSDIAVADADFQQVAVDSPHNFYLLIASEQGLIATLVYATVFAVLLVRGLVRAARPRADDSTAVALAGTGVLGYILVDMITGDLGGPGSIYVALVIGLAGWAAADLDLLPRTPTPPSPPSSPSRPPAAPEPDRVPAGAAA